MARTGPRIPPQLRVLLSSMALGVVAAVAIPFLRTRGIAEWVSLVALGVVAVALFSRATPLRAPQATVELEEDPAIAAMDRDPAWIAEDTRAVRYSDHLMSEAFFQAFERVRVDPPVAGTSTVLFQLDGIWHQFDTISGDLYREVLTRFKMLGELDVVRRPHNQTGRTKVAVNGQPLAVRIEINLTPAGEQELVLVFHREDLARG